MSVAYMFLAPPPGQSLRADQLADTFGLSESPTGRASRIDGHLFLRVDWPQALAAPDGLRFDLPGRQLGVTAFLTIRGSSDKYWRYVGVGRWNEAEVAWKISEVDRALWRAYGV